MKTPIIKLLALLVAMIILVGAPRKAFASKLDDIILAAGITHPRIIQDLRKYLRQKNSKAFALDPITKERFYYWYGCRSKKDAVKRVSKPGLVLLAINREIVWEKEYARYMQSSVGKGRQLMSEGNFQGAIEEFEYALKSADNRWYTYNLIGWAYFKSRQYRLAAINFEKSLNLNNDKNLSQAMLAESLMMSGDLDSAKVQLDKFKDVNELKSNYKHLLVGYLVASGDYKSASIVYEGRNRLGLRVMAVDTGIKVEHVLPKSPADFAGLKPGDVFQTYNGVKLSGIELKDFLNFLKDIPYGSIATATFIRDDKLYKTQIVSGVTADLPKRASQLETVVIQ